MKLKRIKFLPYWLTKMNTHRWQRILFSNGFSVPKVPNRFYSMWDIYAWTKHIWEMIWKLETCCFCCIEYDCTFTVFGWLKKELQDRISVKELISLRSGFSSVIRANQIEVGSLSANQWARIKSYKSEEFLVWFQHKIDTPREDINQYWTITNEEILQYIMKNFFSVESLKPLYIDLIRKLDEIQGITLAT